MGRHDDAHYRKLNPQPTDVIGGWSETADWPKRHIHTLGEVIACLARAWTKGQTMRDLRKAESNLNFLIHQLEVEAGKAENYGTGPVAFKKTCSSLRKQGGINN